MNVDTIINDKDYDKFDKPPYRKFLLDELTSLTLDSYDRKIVDLVIDMIKWDEEKMDDLRQDINEALAGEDW